MNDPNNRRKMFFANSMHKDIFLLVFLASFVPFFITVGCLSYLIFSVTADQIVFPDVIAQTLFPAARKVLAILMFALPVVTIFFLVLAHKVAHTILGPFDRIVRELGECVAGKRHKHLFVRKNDKFWPLVNKINLLLDKLPVTE